MRRKLSHFQTESLPSGQKKVHVCCHKVPGTTSTVDSLRTIGSDASGNHFLSRMHSDYNGSLTKTSLPEGSIVLCSATTAALVQKLVGVSDKCIRIPPMVRPVRDTGEERHSRRSHRLAISCKSLPRCDDISLSCLEYSSLRLTHWRLQI